MTRTIFHEISTEQGWILTTQVEILLRYIENQQSQDVFRDYLDDLRLAASSEAERDAPADRFMWAVADLLQHPALTLDAAFQEYCANAHDTMAPEHAAESWWMGFFS